MKTIKLEKPVGPYKDEEGYYGASSFKEKDLFTGLIARHKVDMFSYILRNGVLFIGEENLIKAVGEASALAVAPLIDSNKLSVKEYGEQTFLIIRSLKAISSVSRFIKDPTTQICFGIEFGGRDDDGDEVKLHCETTIQQGNDEYVLSTSLTKVADVETMLLTSYAHKNGKFVNLMDDAIEIGEIPSAMVALMNELAAFTFFKKPLEDCVEKRQIVVRLLENKMP